MLFKKDFEHESILQLTSFMDVIFILLLFFVVTSLIMKQSGGRQGERAYLKVKNAFSEVKEVRAYVTVFIYKKGGTIKYRLIHKGAPIDPDNYLYKLKRESRREEPSQGAIIYTTSKMLRDPSSSLSREMDKLTANNIKDVLGCYKRILPSNELNFAIVAQPDIPFFDVIQLYSFMKMTIEEGGLGASQVVLLEHSGNLNALLNKIKWGASQ